MKTFYLNTQKIILILFFLVSQIFTSCAQLTSAGRAEKSYEKGQYDIAVRYAVEALRKNPTKKKAQTVILPAYNAALNMYEDKILQLKIETSNFQGEGTVRKREEIVKTYEKLISLQKEVKTLPPITPKRASSPLKFEFKDYYTPLMEARNSLSAGKEDAAELHYQKGLTLMEDEENIALNKEAAKEFKRAQTFVSGYKDTEKKYQMAKKAGTTRIAIFPFENKSGRHGFGAVGEMQSDLLIAAIVNSEKASEFIQVISRDELDKVLREQKLNDLGVIDDNSLVEVGKILGVHEIITGKINQMITSYPKTVSSSWNEKKTVVVDKKVVYENGKKKTQDVKGEVKARVTKYSKKASASINGSFKIIDIKTAQIKKSDSFTEKFEFFSEWGRSSGDKRALSYSSNRLCRTTEQISPTPEEMINKVSDKLARALASKVLEYTK